MPRFHSLQGSCVRVALAFCLFVSQAHAGSMTLLGVGKSAAAAPSTTTWDAGHTGGVALVLSNGNLTTTWSSPSGFVGVRSVSSQSSGKFFYQITAAGAGGDMQVGAVTASNALTSNLGSSGTPQGFGYTTNGTMYCNAGNVGSMPTWVNGNILSVAIDVTAKLAWMRVGSGNWNNNVSADPATGVGGNDISGCFSGALFAAINDDINGDAATANFGATSYSPAAPSGFGNW